MDEIVQYFVVNSELEMSPGKIAAQVGHVATMIAYHAGRDSITTQSQETKWFSDWFYNDQKKIVLRGKQKELENLIAKGFIYIRDNGLTEIPAGSLTVVGLTPMPKDIAQEYVKRLQLFK
ncbi:MAG: hypothetical protein K0R18_93 [Bacillales bacterium]|nr:hypothetical protein [Bacillales bacterium]